VNIKLILINISFIGFYAINGFGQTNTDTTITKSKVPDPVTSPLSMPGMSGPLTVNPRPLKFGDIYISGVASGLVQLQNGVFRGDKPLQSDISNSQVFIQKIDGVVQFFVEVGAYSLPDIGVPYLRSGLAANAFYGVLPQGYIKIAPTNNFSVEVGKLPSFIGAEPTFSFENMNIQRGLLWNQENSVDRGVQLNYTAGPLAFSISLNDGFYSNKYNWLSGSLTYTVNGTNALALIGGSSMNRTNISSLVTPLYQNNEQVYNLIYTRTSGPWTIQPYLQYTSVPPIPLLKTTQSAATYSAALLANYLVPGSGFSLPFRLEYITSTGSPANGTPNLIYGAGSNAWSVTVTPTYQYNAFFVRGELSYVKAGNIEKGSAFGPTGNEDTQSRALIELGFLF